MYIVAYEQKNVDTFIIILTLVVANFFKISQSSTKQIEKNLMISEEIPVNSRIFDLKKEAELIDEFGLNVLDIIRFKQINRPIFDVFVVEKNGIIRTKGRIDREEMCPNQRIFESKAIEPFRKIQCEIRLDIAIEPVSYFRLIKINVEILDVNDNSPKFESPLINLDISESAPVNSVFKLPSPVDKDSKQFSIKRYGLENSFARSNDASENSKLNFAINSTIKDDLSSELHLTLIRELDREKEDKLFMTLTAVDGGSPPLTGTLEIVVNVKDANDNAPSFEYKLYEVVVPENFTVNSTIAKVKADDADFGENGEVEYHFDTRTAEKFGKIFQMNHFNGEVVVVSSLDYENQTMYKLMITARDNGSPETKSSETVVVIKVVDVNDNKPQITITPLQSLGSDKIGVYENLNFDTFVAKVQVTDADYGNNGRITCQIEQTNFFKLRFVNADGEYEILTSVMFDREQNDRYLLKIICHDMGDVPLYTDKLIEIEILDVNDNFPQFEKNLYEIDLRENNDRNTDLVKVLATDLDIGSNAKVFYTLNTPPAADLGIFAFNDFNLNFHSKLFSVQPNSGIVRVLESIDREKYPTIDFSVFACDNENFSSNSRCSKSRIKIFILDINDCAPQFHMSTFSFSVNENQPLGTEIGMVVAKDDDSPPYNEFSFHLISTSDNKPHKLFDVNRKSGKIVTATKLDREYRSDYQFLIEARDDNNASLTSTATIVVYVLDENDNDPEWIEPAAPSYGNVRKKKKKNEFPLREGVDFVNDVSGEFENGNVNAIYKNYEKSDDENNYSDLNDFPATTIPIYRFVKPGSLVTRFKTTDRDIGNNAQIYYRLDYDNSEYYNMFKIDNHTGALTLASTTFQNLPPNATISIIATAIDKGIPPRSSILRFFVKIDETPPNYVSDNVHRNMPWLKGRMDDDGSKDGELFWGFQYIDAMILGLSCLIVLAILIIVVVVVCCLLIRRRRRRKAEKNVDDVKFKFVGEKKNISGVSNMKPTNSQTVESNSYLTDRQPLTANSTSYNNNDDPLNNNNNNNNNNNKANTLNRQRNNLSAANGISHRTQNSYDNSHKTKPPFENLHQPQHSFDSSQQRALKSPPPRVKPEPIEMLLSDFEREFVQNRIKSSQPACQVSICALEYSKNKNHSLSTFKNPTNDALLANRGPKNNPTTTTNTPSINSNKANTINKTSVRDGNETMVGYFYGGKKGKIPSSSNNNANAGDICNNGASSDARKMNTISGVSNRNKYFTGVLR